MAANYQLIYSVVSTPSLVSRRFVMTIDSDWQSAFIQVNWLKEVTKLLFAPALFPSIL